MREQHSPALRLVQVRLVQGLAIALSLAWPAIASAQTADTILFNGKILTVDNDFSVRQALAIGTAGLWLRVPRPR